jgi:3',5'-cyclic AMP phosphodiesterase CpdA
VAAKVLILRFRDLVNPSPGYTIGQHREVITKNGYTWWGWWKKQAEKVPEQLLTAIKADAAKKPAKILLLDSGQRKLYRAELLDVLFVPGSDEVPAPEDGVKTPSYYSTVRFAAWFKIQNIQEAPETDLTHLVYADVPHDEFVQVAPDQILGRRIDRISDLLLFGNITYWVAVDATDGAKAVGPIHVRSPSAISPDSVITASRHLILHITDLHYGDHHAFPVAGAEHDHTLAHAVFQALNRKPELLPGIVIVTGDLTWTGSDDEFEEALEGLDSLRSQLGLTRQHFVIIPGNHDLGWKREQKEGKWTGRYVLATGDSKAPYQRFFKKWYQSDPDEHLRIARRFFVHGGPPLDVVGFNSSSLQQVKGKFQGMGRIPEAHYEEVAQLMRWSPNAGERRPAVRRLVLTHHHLLPVVSLENPTNSERGFGIALDAGHQLRLAAKYGVDLVLHGHQHEPFAGYFRAAQLMGPDGDHKRGALVLGGGSAGVRDEDLGPIKYRCFGLLDVDYDVIRYRLFTTHLDGHSFHEQTSIVSDGSGWSRT